ncbi:MAG TPA: hypothetical protein VKE40_07295 [Gemmataceae bacterium]|nr:hypothetical protein [Gemmataceae bacterium]
MPTIVSAGNVLVPAYLALVAKGYRVTRAKTGRREDPEEWRATKGAARFVAEDPLSLLGLVAMREARGRRWEASDAEIDAFFDRFP